MSTTNNAGAKISVTLTGPAGGRVTSLADAEGLTYTESLVGQEVPVTGYDSSSQENVNLLENISVFGDTKKPKEVTVKFENDDADPVVTLLDSVVHISNQPVFVKVTLPTVNGTVRETYFGGILTGNTNSSGDVSSAQFVEYMVKPYYLYKKVV